MEVLDTSRLFEHGHDHDGVYMNMDGVCISRFKASAFL